MTATDFETKLKKYADVVIKVGLNLQPGQRLIIDALVENTALVHALTERAYHAGARFVSVLWWDERVDRVMYEKASMESMEEAEEWRVAALVDYMKKGDAVVIVHNTNPDLAEGIDPQKVGQFQKSWSVNQKPFRDLRGVLASNCTIISAPSSALADKVLPDVPVERRVEKLWELMFGICRVNEDDPVAAWQEHRERLGKRSNYLNKKTYDALKFTGPGTDLTVGLPEGHIWNGGSKKTKNGIEMVANIPTEEVFTIPHRARIDGKVRATKPLNYMGLADKFSVTFEKGKIVDVSAEVGEAHLKNIIATDEGSSYIGEIALVAHSSPISQSGRVFYNILYDENASCHMAIGSAYRFSLEGGIDMTDEEFVESGGNVSAVHADFMIGSSELDVDGITADGQVEPVMRAGEFVIGG
ncbi:MAG: aminopeptidase [Chloroflexota bacterium]